MALCLKQNSVLVWSTLKTSSSIHFVLMWQYGFLLSSNWFFFLVPLLFVKIWSTHNRKKTKLKIWKASSIKFSFWGWTVRCFMAIVYKLESLHYYSVLTQNLCFWDKRSIYWSFLNNWGSKNLKENILAFAFIRNEGTFIPWNFFFLFNSK